MSETFSLKDATTGVDVTPYVLSYEWGGSLDQAARHLNFVIAYTSKDKSWTNATINLGDRVAFSMTDETGQALKLFNGVVFLQNRSSESYTMEFTAYDNLIYLAKSHTTMKFSNCQARDIIKQVCGALGVTVGDVSCKDLDKMCDFIADDMSGSDILQKALKAVTATTGQYYHVYMAIDQNTGAQKLNVVRADTKIENYTISDTVNMMTTSHSASIEDMVNQVAVCDKDGNITGYVKNDDDVKKYGLLQGVYRVNDKENTEQAARAMLKKVQEQSSLTALGNIQCIAGYAVGIQEEQISGTFIITSDTHVIEAGKHTMTLRLGYLAPKDDGKDATTEGNVTYQPSASTAANGNLEASMQEADAAWIGQTTPYHENGCVYAATGYASYYSPWAAQESQNGVVSVPALVSDAKASGMYQSFDAGSVEQGDIIVYTDNDHVTVARGAGGDYIGNSSSQDKVVHGSNFYEMGGLYPIGLIKTSHG